ncbi:cellulosome-anchoring protein precursor [Andreesenia angusta]|uniref:Cellulosome-anchoring protein n=1 Tax=Andreesenia angusta TaxID=39480 RepID=A0A1S1V4Y9_9FIRM|nr:S-layer homology domain-containing protein [Andreesenia angusta]OHW61652.1 cellulosome-anchoring protein precursor [Andreesenia angusta]
MLKRSKFAIALLATLSIGLVPVQQKAEATSDIRGHWAEERIGLLISEGIISGYPDGTFKPNKDITREEASKIVSEYVGEKKTGSVELKDISGVWSEPYIEHLYLEGIVNGYPDKTFKPKNNIVRSEFVTMVHNYLKKNGEIKDYGKAVEFKDVNGHWAKKSIEAVSKFGYIKGYPDKTFKPDEPISRAEVSSIVALMIEDKVLEIKTPWSESHESNMDVLIEELGFEKDRSGNWDGVPGLSNPIGVYRDRPDIYEVSIVVRDWQYEDVPRSEKIPLVFDEILKFYFRDEAEYAYSKMDDESVTEFESSDRFIRLRDHDGKLYIYLGYKDRDKFDKWW